MAVAWLVLAALGLAIHVIIRAGGPLAQGARYRMLTTVFGAILLAGLITVLLVKGEAAAFSLIG